MPLPMHNGRTDTPLADDRHEEIRLGGGAAPWGSEPKPFRSTPERVSTLRFYLSVIGRRRLPMLIAFLIPVVFAAALTVTAKKQYQGSALVVINRQSLSDQLTGTPHPTASASDYLTIITTDAYAAGLFRWPTASRERSRTPMSAVGRSSLRRLSPPSRTPTSSSSLSAIPTRVWPSALDRIRPAVRHLRADPGDDIDHRDPRERRRSARPRASRRATGL